MPLDGLVIVSEMRLIMFIIYCCFKRQVSDIGTYDGGYDIFFNNLVLNGFSIETVTKVPYCGNLGQKRLLLI